MRETFQHYLPRLFAHEGGYVDHPRDPGGATNYGITIATLRGWRSAPVSKTDVRLLTKEEAGRIYKIRYWDAIGADHLAPGVDAALFDIAVNSGPGRAKQWAPLADGKGAVLAIRAICARRRAFFRSLRTFDVFGKGWMRRVNEVEAWAIAWAVRQQGKPAAPVLDLEARASLKKSKAAGGGAVVAGGSAVAAPRTELAANVDWVALALIGGGVLLGIAYLGYQAWAHKGRAKALRDGKGL